MFEFDQIVPDCARRSDLYPCGCEFVDAMQLVQNIMNFLIVFGTFVLVLLLAYVGFLFITSRGNPGALDNAKKIAMSAVIGFVIMMGGFLIVNTIMNTFAKEDPYGNWNSFFNIQRGACNISPGPTGTGPGVGVGSGTAPDSRFTYQSGIERQVQHASPQLTTLLNCMAAKVPGNVGEISSISDSVIVNGTRTFAECAAGASQCAHVPNSWHYGGVNNIGRSYAVDFGDERNARELIGAANECGASRVADEGSHIHVEVRP